jgi:hypothetical protein
MEEAMNCWEFKKCGREPGGANMAKLGVCPAASERSVNKTNQGKNGGRICWSIAGTLCGGKVQGSFAQKRTTCLECDFFNKVKTEEGDSFRMSPA